MDLASCWIQKKGSLECSGSQNCRYRNAADAPLNQCLARSGYRHDTCWVRGHARGIEYNDDWASHGGHVLEYHDRPWQVAVARSIADP